MEASGPGLGVVSLLAVVPGEEREEGADGEAKGDELLEADKAEEKGEALGAGTALLGGAPPGVGASGWKALGVVSVLAVEGNEKEEGTDEEAVVDEPLGADTPKENWAALGAEVPKAARLLVPKVEELDEEAKGDKAKKAEENGEALG